MKKKKIILWAAVLAALSVLAVILWIAAFSPMPGRGDETVIEPQHTATPEPAVPQTAEPTASPAPIPTPVPTEEAGETPAPTNKPASTATTKSGAAFTLKIKDRTISVAHGVDEATLDKTPGWLTTSASPGQDGLCVVYGHRNRAHLRVLEKVKKGDTITAAMPDGTVYTYTVTDIQIYENTADLRLPLTDGKTICLVTCYPFRYSGSAPGKCVVVGILN